MKLIKYFNFLFIVAFVLSFIHHNALNAQNNASSKIEATYINLSALSASFKQTTYVKLIDKNLIKEGNLFLSKPGKLRIEYNDINTNKYISDGKYIWIFNSKNIYLEEHKVNKNTFPREALDFLRGFGKINKHFDTKAWIVDKKTPGHIYLTLYPKSKNAPYEHLNCDFNSGNILETLEIHNKSGNIARYNFFDIKLNPALNPSLFQKPSL